MSTTTTPDPAALARRIQADMAALVRALDQQGEREPRPARHLPKRTTLLRAPTPAELTERGKLWGRYTLLTHQLGYEMAAAERENTKAFFAARCRLSVSEISRWLPPGKAGRRREIKVGSKT